MTINTSNTVSLGNYPLVINAMDGNLTNTAAINWMVGTFAISVSPASRTVAIGSGNAIGIPSVSP